MFNVEYVTSSLKKLSDYPDLLESNIDLSCYPSVEDETCGGEVSLEELYSSDEVKAIYIELKPYLDNPDISSESQIIPIIRSLGNVFICLGIGEYNKGFVYLLDFDFGCFLLDKSLNDFLSKLAKV